MNRLIVYILLAIALLASCTDNTKYDISTYLPNEDRRDSLLTDLITYMYKAPEGVRYRKERFDPKHRGYYMKQLPKFTVDKYYVTEDGIHYYFLVRPARNAHGYNRGAGGKFRLNDEGAIYDFEELYNTPMIPDEALLKKGRELFREMVKKGDVAAYIGKKEYVEFPNDRCIYDKEIRDWRYVR